MQTPPRLWPSSFVKVTFILIIRWTLCCWVLLPSTKLLVSIEFEIWTIVWRKLKWCHNDVITDLIFMKFKNKLTKGISKRNTELHFDRHKRNMKKKWVLRHLYCDLDLCPKVTNFNRVQASAVSNHLAKTASGSSVRLEFCSQENIRHT